MATRKKIVVILEKTETGFSAYAMDYPVYTTGTNMSEVTDNMKEAFSLYSEKINSDELDFSVQIDFKQFFQYYKVLNSKVLAKKIGMNPTLLSQYVRGHKKPSEKQRRRILYGINKIGHELADITALYEKP
jgi:predicted RNase H-like HicB family nuclease